jgi:hypothetical protein
MKIVKLLKERIMVWVTYKRFTMLTTLATVYLSVIEEILSLIMSSKDNNNIIPTIL